VNDLYTRPVKSSVTNVGATCQARLEVK